MDAELAAITSGRCRTHCAPVAALKSDLYVHREALNVAYSEAMRLAC